MKRFLYAVLAVLLFVCGLNGADNEPNRVTRKNVRNRRVLQVLPLPKADVEGVFTVEQVIAARRSVRQFNRQSLDMKTVGQLLWAGQGITDEVNSYRAAPSAGAIYPFKLYVVIRGGVYIYDPENGGKLEKILNGDTRDKLSKAALGQAAVKDAPCSIILAGNARGLVERYSSNAKQFMYIEAGHIAQNILLQATAIGLGGVPIGSFDEDKIKELYKFPSGTEAVYIVSVGVPASGALLLEEEAPKQEAATQERPRAVIMLPDEMFSNDEFFDTLDGLSIAGFDVDIAGEVLDIYRSDERGFIETNILVNRINVADYDAIVLVSGRKIESFAKKTAVLDIIYEAFEEQKVVAAIGRSAKLLGEAGIVNGYTVTGDNSARTTLRKAGANFTGGRVERDDNIITADDYEAAATFARLIAEAVEGRQSLSPSSSGRFVPPSVRKRRGEPTDSERDRRRY